MYCKIYFYHFLSLSDRCYVEINLKRKRVIFIDKITIIPHNFTIIFIIILLIIAVDDSAILLLLLLLVKFSATLIILLDRANFYLLFSFTSIIFIGVIITIH